MRSARSVGALLVREAFPLLLAIPLSCSSARMEPWRALSETCDISASNLPGILGLPAYRFTAEPPRPRSDECDPGSGVALRTSTRLVDWTVVWHAHGGRVCAVKVRADATPWASDELVSGALRLVETLRAVEQDLRSWRISECQRSGACSASDNPFEWTEGWTWRREASDTEVATRLPRGLSAGRLRAEIGWSNEPGHTTVAIAPVDQRVVLLAFRACPGAPPIDPRKHPVWRVYPPPHIRVSPPPAPESPPAPPE